jgi:hypothetical protein
MIPRLSQGPCRHAGWLGATFAHGGVDPIRLDDSLVAGCYAPPAGIVPLARFRFPRVPEKGARPPTSAQLAAGGRKDRMAEETWTKRQHRGGFPWNLPKAKLPG